MKMMLFTLKRIRSVPLKIFFFLLSFQILVLQGQSTGGIPQVASGVLVRWQHFDSKYIGKRTVDIWRPFVLDDTVVAYSVLYMNDGQMLFDSKVTWNHQEWKIDETLQAFINEGKVPPTMVVGIWNGGSKRHSEFFPQKVFENMNAETRQWCAQNGRNYSVGGDSFSALSDNYLKFIVEELKPAIDSLFFVKKDPQNTFIGGSSMGGLISMYAMCEYPQVFGGALCFSTHWPGVWKVEDNPIPGEILRYMNEHLPVPGNNKWYFDLGNQTLDALYPGIQAQVDSQLHKAGFNETNWITRFFKGDDHSEKSWSRRFGAAYWWLNPQR